MGNASNSSHTICQVGACNAAIRRLGMCHSHYMKNWRYGTPTPTPVIKAYGDRKCDGCGCQFEAKASNSLYCSTQCRAAAKYVSRPRVPCNSCGAATSYIKGTTKAKKASPICANCRSSRSSKQCVMSDCQRKVQARGMCVTHWSRWRRSQPGYERKRYQPTVDIKCEHCGNIANVYRYLLSSQKYCSLICANQAKGIAARAGNSQVAIYTGLPYRRTPNINQNPIRQSDRKFKSGQCRVCCAWFISLNNDRTCSPECWKAELRSTRKMNKEKRRAVKRNAFVANVYRKRVFELDGYRCHLCNKLCDKTKTVPHHRAPTIDHVIPLAAGGTHEPANCRTACFMCNATKGNRGGGEQLALIG